MFCLLYSIFSNLFTFGVIFGIGLTWPLSHIHQVEISTMITSTLLFIISNIIFIITIIFTTYFMAVRYIVEFIEKLGSIIINTIVTTYESENKYVTMEILRKEYIKAQERKYDKDREAGIMGFTALIIAIKLGIFLGIVLAKTIESLK